MIRSILPGALAAMVLAASASAAPTHQWTFNDGTANDSVGTAHGTLFGGATISGGSVTLAGGPVNTPDTSANNVGPYVDLAGPTIAINTYTALSAELWLKSSPANAPSTAPLFTMAAALGRHTLNTGGQEQPWSGHDYLMLQPTRGNGPAASRVAITNDRFEAETGVNGLTQIADNQLHQMVATIDATELRYYFDGALVGSVPLGANSIAQMANDVAYLGRSLYNDPFFAGSIDQFTIHNNVLTPSEISTSFNAGPIGTGSPAIPLLTIDRGTGAVTLTKPGTPVDMFKYTLNSTTGALDPTKWQTVADNRDADSGGSFDANDTWTVLSSTAFSLSEEDPVDGGGDNGGLLGAGAGATASLPLLTTGGWVRTYREDVSLTIDILVDGVPTSTSVNVAYSGNGGNPYKRSDFNFDNLITVADYIILRNNSLTTITEATAAKSYVKGDIDGDLRNDIADFRLFKADYITANGPGAWEALVGVPEPGSLALASLAGWALVARRRK